jgi:hypothetical protein
MNVSLGSGAALDIGVPEVEVAEQKHIVLRGDAEYVYGPCVRAALIHQHQGEEYQYQAGKFFHGEISR